MNTGAEEAHGIGSDCFFQFQRRLTTHVHARKRSKINLQWWHGDRLCMHALLQAVADSTFFSVKNTIPAIGFKIRKRDFKAILGVSKCRSSRALLLLLLLLRPPPPPLPFVPSLHLSSSSMKTALCHRSSISPAFMSSPSPVTCSCGSNIAVIKQFPFTLFPIALPSANNRDTEMQVLGQARRAAHLAHQLLPFCDFGCSW